MYTMSQINHIKDLSSCGYRISEISKETGADPKTIKKYLAQENFPPHASGCTGTALKTGSFQAGDPGMAGRGQTALAQAASYSKARL